MVFINQFGLSNC